MTTIQWFPGHMAKARREVEENLKRIDVVIELLDARLPLSSRNPMMHDILGDKPRVVVLNKRDLADEAVNREWVHYFRNDGVYVVPIDAQSGAGVRELPPLVATLMQRKWEALEAKGIRKQLARCMIVGIPNVGKSSLINRLARRSATKTGNKPGVTKAQQWIKVDKHIQLLDTPGILWPKFDDPVVGQRLAASGAIKSTIFAASEAAFYALTLLRNRYPDALQSRYRLSELPDDSGQLLEEIGKKRGCMRSGGTIDLEKASELLLHDLQTGKLGRISFEQPADWVADS
ncbi:ribosome biogenesis GTPase YlqF [Numidum massiliense]|uniref:ribosome biogenesis GTPase YlqF n=1 Tax=Numidum massiliense TaxID=1522315 RepID=UPI0006D5823E|nr:ribosome biogenesis GTPase YlqF [Numidum massiliense]